MLIINLLFIFYIVIYFIYYIKFQLIINCLLCFDFL